MSEAPPKQALLEEALRIVTGPRQELYGKPSQNFIDTAKLLNAYLSPKIAAVVGSEGDEYNVVAPHDVAVIILLLKVARIVTSPGHKDHWVDIAGYSACGWEAWLDYDFSQEVPEPSMRCQSWVSADVEERWKLQCMLDVGHANDHNFEPRCGWHATIGTGSKGGRCVKHEGHGDDHLLG